MCARCAGPSGRPRGPRLSRDETATLPFRHPASARRRSTACPNGRAPRRTASAGTSSRPQASACGAPPIGAHLERCAEHPDGPEDRDDALDLLTWSAPPLSSRPTSTVRRASSAAPPRSWMTIRRGGPSSCIWPPNTARPQPPIVPPTARSRRPRSPPRWPATTSTGAFGSSARAFERPGTRTPSRLRVRPPTRRSRRSATTTALGAVVGVGAARAGSRGRAQTAWSPTNSSVLPTTPPRRRDRRRDSGAARRRERPPRRPGSVAEAEARCMSFLPRVRGPLAEHDLRGAIAVLQARRGVRHGATAIADASPRSTSSARGPTWRSRCTGGGDRDARRRAPAAEPHLQRAMAAAERARRVSAHRSPARSPTC